MIPWKLLDKAQTPGIGEELALYKRDTEFTIMAGRFELMNSRVHNSEDALAAIACRMIAAHQQPKVLIGGLGMGFTLRSALNGLEDKAQVVVSELVPTVVAWNRTYLADLAGSPLEDRRVVVQEIDVAKIIKKAKGEYSAILLDVDNGPDALTQKDNDWLYSLRGLNSAFDALQPKGVLAIWSASSDAGFSKRLCEAGFELDEHRVPARGKSKGKGKGNGKGGWNHVIWTGTRS